MKHYIFFIVAILSCLTGFAQGGYDPENPGDPSPYRKLSVLTSPKAGGSVGTDNDSQIAVGQSVSCYANENKYYQFVHWLKNGEIVSTESRYSFTMPDEDVEMTAVFEFNYNPQSPDDPQEAKPSYRVTLTANPAKGGRFNNSVFKLCEGDSINIYAYNNEGYRFEEWLLDGVLVSTKNPLMVKMTDRELNYTARFSYNPINPSDPAINLFNPGTGEMVIDRFEQGYLSSAVSRLLGDDYKYSDIQSLLISGVMGSSDFGIMYRLSNCATIDLSRTNGYPEIPSYAFESTAALTELMLPSCINSIGRYAFQDCKNLSVLICYAVIPPTLSYGVFDGVDKSLVIKVPAQSIDLYKNTSGWKDYTILPADADVFSITVSLPTDAQDGRYKNMSLELLNTSNGQRYKYLITDKTNYTFGNLMSSTKYSVFVKNAKNEVLGEIVDLEVIDKDLAVSFQTLLQPCNISVKVLTPEGHDVTNDMTIKWFNGENELLHQGSILSGVLESSVVSYAVGLPQYLQSSYLQPTHQTIKVSDSSCTTYNLEPIGKCVLSGKICDKQNKPIPSAIITISQNTNGTYSNSVNAHCDGEGKYSIEVPNVPIKITISANGYIGQTKKLQSASTGIDDIVLEKNTGITVFPSYTFQESIANGESETNWYSDDANIAYRILDSNGAEIANCIYQAGSIILPESVKFDETIIVTAYSKNKKFKDVSQAVFLTSKSAYINLPIVEYGGVSVKSREADNTPNICIIYDNFGKQVGKSTLRNNGALFANLPDGLYTLITMNKSSLLGSVQNLSSLKETPLEEGIDYIVNEINVNSGQISEITIANVPNLDETKLYFTNSGETYFTSNKPQLTIGNYLTLKAKITMKDEYAQIIDAATLIVDIPSNCEFVDNSVISGAGYLGYEYSNNRISIPIQRLSDAVRFCIVPLEGGECKPSAFVKLIINNKEILQPVGLAYFEAKNFSLVAPQKTSKAKIVIRGTATPDSEVLVYDNETLVGSTYSMSNGEWSLNLSLHKPYSKSIHNLYGEVITLDGRRLLTQSRTVDYDQSYVDLSKVTMVYNNSNIVFDHLNGKNTANSYSYVPGKPDFTFIADFTENNPEKITNVVIKVLASDGTIRSIPAEYNSTSGNWVVRTKYTGSNKLPINVSADYELKTNSDVFDLNRHNDDMRSIIHLLQDQQTMISQTSNNLSIINESESKIEMKYYNEETNATFYVQIENMDYSSFISNNTIDDFIDINDESFNIKIKHEITNDNYFLYVLNLNTNELYKILIVERINQSNQAKIIPALLLGGAVSIAYAEFSRREYIRNCEALNDLYRRFNLIKQSFANKNIELNKLLNARCEDGSNKISIVDAFILTAEINRLKIEEHNMERELEAILLDCQNTINYTYMFNIGLSVTQVVIGAASSALNFLRNIQGFSRPLLRITTGVLSAVDGQVGNSVTDALLGDCVNRAEQKINADAIRIGNSYWSLMDKIKASYKECPKDDEEEEEDDEDNNENNENNDEDFPAPPTTPSIDPSGYVYEAVPSNRITGVTATAYFKQQTEDMYGDITETAVVWDATPFGQENPLITDIQGMYAWDVPAGMWQVRFNKEGYEATQSEWLPVPPPQLDVNIGMVQNKQPEVIDARAYEEGIEVQFDKFMDLSTLTTSNIFVTANGEKLNGEIRFIDSSLADEYASEDDADALRYASRVRFVPEEKLGSSTGEIRLTVSRNVLSYAGIPMPETYSQVLDVEKEVQAIVAEDVKVLYGGEKEVTVYALPYEAAIGRTLHISVSSDLIASVDLSEVVLDDEGKAKVRVKGEIPGIAQLSFTIDDVTTRGACTIDVVREILSAEAPTSSRATGTSVYRGTEIELSTESKNATIYFTTDGSCPCDETGTRQKYTQPIVINDNMKILAITSVETGGGETSEVVEFNYTLKRSDMDFQMPEGWTWISHSFENSISPSSLTTDEGVERILGQTGEVIRDPEVGMIGTLTALTASESYKVEASSPTTRQRLSDIAWNPSTPIAVNSGWNWLGYPLSQTMSVNEAFAPTEAETLDIIVGQEGFAQFDGENWIGTLETMNPGKGYMYQSQSGNNIIYNTSLVSSASARRTQRIARKSPLVLDIHKYGVIMPVVATLSDSEGSHLDNEDYQVAAFCGSECRGIGKVVNGLVMMNVYGNLKDVITFVVTDIEGDVTFGNDGKLDFSEVVVGSLFDPYTITIDSKSGVEEVKYEGNIQVSIEGDMLWITGIAADDIDLVEIYDLNGHKLIRETRVSESGIKISTLTDGVYVVIVRGNGEYSYHKIAVR